MATITPTLVARNSSGVIWKWETMTENDTAAPVAIPPHMKDKTLLVTGTFGSGSIGLLGTIDPDQTTVSAFEALNDHTGTEIAPTADDILAVAENCFRYAPGTPTGTSVDIDVWLMAQA